MSGLLAGVHAGSEERPPAPSPRLGRAAHEFEGQLLQQLLKPLTASDSLTGSGDGDGSNAALGEYAAEALAEGISRQGGLGIATEILRNLSRLDTTPAAGAVTGNLHGNTVLRESR